MHPLQMDSHASSLTITKYSRLKTISEPVTVTCAIVHYSYLLYLSVLL